MTKNGIYEEMKQSKGHAGIYSSRSEDISLTIEIINIFIIIIINGDSLGSERGRKSHLCQSSL